MSVASVRLELEASTQLHLEHLASRIGVIDENVTCGPVTNLQEDRVRDAIEAAKLTRNSTVLSANAGGVCSVRIREHDVGKIENVEKLCRESQTLSFAKVKAFLHPHINIVEIPIPEIVPLQDHTRNQNRPVVINAVAVQISTRGGVQWGAGTQANRAGNLKAMWQEENWIRYELMETIES